LGTLGKWAELERTKRELWDGPAKKIGERLYGSGNKLRGSRGKKMQKPKKKATIFNFRKEKSDKG